MSEPTTWARFRRHNAGRVAHARGELRRGEMKPNLGRGDSPLCSAGDLPSGHAIAWGKDAHGENEAVHDDGDDLAEGRRRRRRRRRPLAF